MFINFLSYKSIFSKIKIKKTCQFFETEVIFLYRAVDYLCSVIILSWTLFTFYFWILSWNCYYCQGFSSFVYFLKYCKSCKIVLWGLCVWQPDYYMYHVYIKENLISDWRQNWIHIFWIVCNLFLNFWFRF